MRSQGLSCRSPGRILENLQEQARVLVLEQVQERGEAVQT
jgi:hypothetical protein